jgi:hypothetical protein
VSEQIFAAFYHAKFHEDATGFHCNENHYHQSNTKDFDFEDFCPVCQISSTVAVTNFNSTDYAFFYTAEKLNFVFLSKKYSTFLLSRNSRAPPFVC